MNDTIDSDEFTTIYDDDHTFPFVEDENCNITGFGHQDKGEFARQVNLYDVVTTGEPISAVEQWEPDDIGHAWVVMLPDGEHFTTRGVTHETPGAIPVTTLWGLR